MPACLLVILSHHAGRKEHDKKEEMFWQCSLATGEHFVFETVISCKSKKQIIDVGHFLLTECLPDSEPIVIPWVTVGRLDSHGFTIWEALSQ